MTRAQMMRLIWIDAWLESGEILLRRAHIEQAFGISTAQASLDLRAFRRLFSRRLGYDASAKGYVRGVIPPVFHADDRRAVLTAAAAAERAHYRRFCAKKNLSKEDQP